jgi:hypothetical protein
LASTSTGGRMMTPAEAGRIRIRFAYWVRDEGGALREHNETFGMWSASPEKVIEELRQCGFAPSTYGRSVQRRCSLAISWYSCKVGLGICEPSP